jgi:adenine-specific DNA-methyltransferase
LIVTGEKNVTEKVEGLGGDFMFYTLGEPLDIDKILTGKTLPSYVNLGSWLFHTATGEPLNEKKLKEKHWYLGQAGNYHVWLIYKPDLDFLKSRDAALTLTLAQKISETHRDKSHLVFAPAKFVPNKMLLPLGVEYAPLPFALYRVEKG